MVSSIFAGISTRKYGRKSTMVGAGIFFMLGAGLCAGAVNLAMLVLGRVALGFGVGFANQVCTMESLGKSGILLGLVATSGGKF